MMYSFMHMSLGQMTSYERTNEDVIEELEEEHKQRHEGIVRDSVLTRDQVAAERVLTTMRLYNTVNNFLWQTKACGVMLVGVGVKLAIYAPLSPPDYHSTVFSHQQANLS